jgi:hypothetical protein
MASFVLPRLNSEIRSAAPLLYGANFSLSNAFNRWVLLSGGSSIRSTTTTISDDETWEIRSAAPIVVPDGNPVKFGDAVMLALPAHGQNLLSGAPPRSTTTLPGVDEVWQFVGVFEPRVGQPVMLGDFVGLALNDNSRGFLLSGGGGGVRSSTTILDTDETWVIVSQLPIQ